MTKEELNQEARGKYHNHKIIDFQGFYNHHYYYLGYVESAEPRERLIEEQRIKIKKMKELLNEIYSEFGFSELVKIRNNLPIEIQDLLKEIKENEQKRN